MYRVFLGLLLTGLVIGQADALCYTYRAIEIPTPTGENGQTSLEAINHGGSILGRYANQEPPDGYTVVRKRAQLRVHPLPAPVPGDASWPRCMNAVRDVVGQVGSNGQFVAFMHLTEDGTTYTAHLIDIPGAIASEALGINLARHVVGYYHDAEGVAHGFLRTPDGHLQTIDAPEAVYGTWLAAINARLETVGWYMDAIGAIHGWQVIDGVDTTLDVPGAFYTFPNDINNKGDIVGLHTQGEYGSGFLYRGGAFYDICPPDADVLHCEATGINAAREIVGNVIRTDGLTYGFVATPQPRCSPAVALVELE